MTLSLRYAVRSDRGLVRGNNEDSVYAGPRLLAIADGMGGHAAGEVASKLVISTLEQLDEDRPVGDLLRALRAVVDEANDGIADQIVKDNDLDGMGTTLTALRFSGSQVGLVHVGDSRAYLMRGGHLSQITHDDTYVQSLVDQGQLTADEAASHPRKSVILRALTGTSVEPDVSIREARVGDRYLLCTDGLTDVVSTQTLFETLVDGDPQGCADRLVELALRGGGPDNVTCIVADVVESDYGDDLPVIAGAFMDLTTPQSTRTDSPAERAALINRPAPKPARPARTGQRSRRRWRTPLFILVLLAVVVGIGAGTYAWTQTQYFVGKDGDEVAVFRGVDTQFGPLKFFSVRVHTGLRVDNLTPAARSQVASGIASDSQKQAEAIVERLKGQQLPSCSDAMFIMPTAGPTASSPTDTLTDSSSGASGGSSSASGSSTDSSLSATDSPTPTDTPTPTDSATPLSSPISVAPTPHVNCQPS